MSKTIGEFMTLSPHTIAVERTIADAHRVMREHRIRHLPVLDRGRLVGIVSERDLHLLETLKGVDSSEALVEEAMSPDVFAVPPNSSVCQVVGTMADRKFGSAVVVDKEEVVGIFTAIDGLRLLAELTTND